MNVKYYQKRGFNINREAWKLLHALEADGATKGPSVARDTVNHLWQMQHSDSMVVTREQGPNVEFEIIPC